MRQSRKCFDSPWLLSVMGLPDYKPVSVLRLMTKQSSDHSSWPAISRRLQRPTRNLITERAAPRPLFGLAPHGVYPANRITAIAVRSYRTFSPLPARNRLHNPRRAVLFSVALSVKLALSESPRPLAGMLPYGDRTFLPANPAKDQRGDRPSGKPVLILSEVGRGASKPLGGHVKLS